MKKSQRYVPLSEKLGRYIEWSNESSPRRAIPESTLLDMLAELKDLERRNDRLERILNRLTNGTFLSHLAKVNIERVIEQLSWEGIHIVTAGVSGMRFKINDKWYMQIKDPLSDGTLIAYFPEGLPFEVAHVFRDLGWVFRERENLSATYFPTYTRQDIIKAVNMAKE